MIKSMTGYGKAVAETPQKKISIEIKSLNSKQLDINLKLPWLYREKEAEIRNIISQKLERGKIDFNIYFDILGDEGIPVINKLVVKSYYKQLKEIAGELNISIDEQLLPAIIRLPDAMKTEKPELTEDEWETVRENILESLLMLDQFRIEEGKAIETNIKSCLSNILTSLQNVEYFEQGRIEKVRERLTSILKENAVTENIDKNRFEQELIFYLEKFDINEEKVRLRKHCEYFINTIEEESPNGRKLSFIAQEIGREINTIGSKANDASIQRLVVMMKDELEKIKEQINNVL